MTKPKRIRQPTERRVPLKVELTLSELAAVSRAAVVVTSAFDLPTVNAAERALRKVRAAAKNHPELP